ncbi:MAG TPA: hypothetical protein VFP12_15570 [Allosphingosinicella sp.]|nr:hypothetical protein [Allosphingosinicella sp.]
MPKVTVDLSEEDIKAVLAQAKARGVSANTIIQEAVTTQKVISENVGEKDDLLIKKGDRFQKVVFKK